jgi:hypothetical protein
MPPLHGLDVGWSSVLDSESIGDRRRRCDVGKRPDAQGKQCRRSYGGESIHHRHCILSIVLRPAGLANSRSAKLRWSDIKSIFYPFAHDELIQINQVSNVDRQFQNILNYA